MFTTTDRGYKYEGSTLNPSHRYLLPQLRSILDSADCQPGDTVFDLGCGNGSVAAEVEKMGFAVVGVDPSQEGLEFAHRQYPDLKLFHGSSDENLADTYGTFPVVYSLEVVEHVYSPARYAATLYSLVQPGGTAIVSTPYHGYTKNLVLAASGKMDAHFTALWEHGHIKFWSRRTLTALLVEAGFVDIQIYRVGRIPALAKSMVASARRLECR